MIGPLAQRQIHVVSYVEAMRQAVDAGDQQTREIIRKRVADDRLAEAQNEVPMISHADGMRTEEHPGHRQGQPNPNADGAPAEEEGADSEAESNRQADSADSHLDFLA